MPPFIPFSVFCFLFSVEKNNFINILSDELVEFECKPGINNEITVPKI